jgi:hypothetical protein
MFELAALILCLAVVIAIASWRAPLPIWAVTMLAIGLGSQGAPPEGGLEMLPFRPLNFVAWVLSAIFVAFSIPPLRRRLSSAARDAFLIGRPMSTHCYDISLLRNCALHVNGHAIHAHADCSPLHRQWPPNPHAPVENSALGQWYTRTIGRH